MRTNIRKIGNSAGVILPSVILKKLHLSEGDAIEISENKNQIMITPKQEKPKYTLKELLSQCDLNATMPEVVKEWDEMSSVSLESL
ncbi:MAG: AbrB/MazE/SpoVT family DNA-binding domain-containing protein [Proteobacteria bacterium]|nr:AbrB/MazE/SpoVT family DNA-binding domain-containing protein [Pseudomonadota bacterium]